MWFLVRSMLFLTFLGCLALLGISIWPGVLNELIFIVFLFSVLWVPLVLIVLVVLAIVLYRRHTRGQLSPLPKREVAATAIVLLSTLILLKFYVPRRAAFRFSRSAFEQMTATAPVMDCAGAGESHLDRRLGIYHVDQYARDPRGGVYFRVFAGSDGIGPDTMSYGFAYQPNQQGTPFGAAHYCVFRLSGDWYWYRASDDWF